MKHLLWVYGSLKKGFPRNKVLEDQIYIGTACTQPKYFIYEIGGYPGLIDSNHEDFTLNGGNEIWGELYEVGENGLQTIDKIERVHQGLFLRQVISLSKVYPVRLPINRKPFNSLNNLEAEAYFYQKPVKGARDCGAFWGNNE